MAVKMLMAMKILMIYSPRHITGITQLQHFTYVKVNALLYCLCFRKPSYSSGKDTLCGM